MRFHAIQNVETALRFLRYKEIKLVNIRGEDIVDGNPKLTLGLIWTIILHFQVRVLSGFSPNSAKQHVKHLDKRKYFEYFPVMVLFRIERVLQLLALHGYTETHINISQPI